MESVFGELISSYSRAEAINDCVLVDVGAAYPVIARAHYKVPIAFTAALWSRIEAAAASVSGASREGFVHDVLYLAKTAKDSGDPSRRRFTIKLDEVVELEAIVGPGDNLEPVLTVGFLGED